MGKLTILFTVLALGSPGAAATARAAEQSLALEPFGAWNSYSMKDINDGLDATDANNGSSFEKLQNGFTGGVSLRYWPNSHWMFSGTWEPLLVQSRDNNQIATEADRVNLNANSLQLTAGYFAPWKSKGKAGIGAGIGTYSVVGHLVDGASTPAFTEIKGTGIGYHLGGLAEWELTKGLGLTGMAGYRIADIELDDTDNGSGNPVEASYTGFLGRLGFSFAVPLVAH